VLNDIKICVTLVIFVVLLKKKLIFLVLSTLKYQSLWVWHIWHMLNDIKICVTLVIFVVLLKKNDIFGFVYFKISIFMGLAHLARVE
jgi:hypothetical protein